tara:strand:+ start:2214 stop:3017 length:804 start_codon:yes stop_codon:yes gene_type:complete
MKKIFLILLLLPFLVFPQDNYQKNSHVNIRLKETRNKYKIYYTFKDHFDRIHNKSFVFKKEILDQAISKLGVPDSMYDRYIINPENLIKREHILKEGLYMKRGNKLDRDYNAIINYYRDYFKPISKYLIKLLEKQNKDNRINRIEIAMKFIQDIPYGIPEESHSDKHDDGCFAPPEVLLKGYGDCDSKSFLFVCILSHMINPNDIIFVKGENHLLSAVKYDSISGGKYFTHNKRKYYICETAGPGRPLFGKKSTSLGDCYVYPLLLK